MCVVPEADVPRAGLRGHVLLSLQSGLASYTDLRRRTPRPTARAITTAAGPQRPRARYLLLQYYIPTIPSLRPFFHLSAQGWYDITMLFERSVEIQALGKPSVPRMLMISKDHQHAHHQERTLESAKTERKNLRASF